MDHCQEQLLECTKRFNRVSSEIHNGELRRTLTRTSFPAHQSSKESSERRGLGLPSREPFLEGSLRFNGVSHGIYKGKKRKMLTRTSFHHPYTGESRERSMSRRQSNLKIR
ncbi:unnamed protein product [Microthlaspi erraticum]|uniref:Uncharacterized protein n=1 Tax=Microthlaspi erraticum TaxID=1685480 RepID=A0A6D2HGM9_9BRAS|nr:unnamed protein product [Microthlaspi erraticum]